MTQKKQSKVKIIVSLFMVVLVGLGLIFAVNTQKAFATTLSTVDAVEDTLSFTLTNNNTEYKVRARNKQITKAKIPAEYNGLPVTEIADSGFSSCKSLTVVEIPSSVKRIGTYAFYRCSALKKCYGMQNVETIGNYAFSDCPAMGNLIIPSKIQKVGKAIARNNSNDIYVRLSEEYVTENAIMPESTGTTGEVIYGNQLSCTEMYSPTDETVKIGYSVDSGQNLNDALQDPNAANVSISNNKDFIIKCVYQEKNDEGIVTDTYPILNVSEAAFSDTYCNSITLEYDSNYRTDYCVNLRSYAFAYIEQITSINIKVNVTFEDEDYENGTSQGVFSNSQMSTVTLPDTINKIVPYMFEYCSNLTTVKSTNSNVADNTLEENITYIGEGAFIACTAIDELTIKATNIYIDNSAFANWGDVNGQIINFNVKKPLSTWNVEWDADIQHSNVIINYLPTRVVLNKQGGTGGSDYVDVIYGQPVPRDVVMPSHSDSHKVFDGYYSAPKGQGSQYYDENMVSLRSWGEEELNESNPVNFMYANWKNEVFQIELDNGTAIGGTTKTEFAYSEILPTLTGGKPVLDGYVFKGYYTQANGQGEQYYDENLTSSKVYLDTSVNKLYAYFEPQRILVILNNGNGVGSVSRIYIEYNTMEVYKEITDADTMQMYAPTQEGYHFGGYYDQPNGLGNKYFTSVAMNNAGGEITCIRACGTTEMIDLYARWEQIYTINYAGCGCEIPNIIMSRISLEEDYNGTYVLSVPDVDGYKDISILPTEINSDNIGPLTIQVIGTMKTLDECYDSASNAYRIWTTTQFLSMRNKLSYNYIRDNYILMADLDFEGTLTTRMPVFAGNFDGQGHAISGIDIAINNSNQETNTYIGLFDKNLGKIENLTVEGTITVEKLGAFYIGLICGQNEGTINNCVSKSSKIYCSALQGFVAGITGNNQGNISNCINEADICASGTTGGIAAYSGGNAGYITDCRNYGKITHQWKGGVQSVGGIIGFLQKGTIQKCANFGDIEITANVSSIDEASMNRGRIVGLQYEKTSTYSNDNDGSGSKIISTKLQNVQKDIGTIN